MKLLLEDLIYGKYYRVMFTDANECCYFKFKNKSRKAVHSFSYQIIEDLKTKDIEYINDSYIFNIDWFHDDCDYLEEIHISSILELIPNDDIDKINYLRRKKNNKFA